MPGGEHATSGLNPEGRRAALEAARRERFDLLVVGGGITGAGVARAAALLGLSTLLVEKSDFGAGTSSRSSKIIHGGVRYLEYLRFGLVRESARERRTLRRIAPHLVHGLPFLYPVHGEQSLLVIRAGLRLFDLMAGAERGEWSRRLSPDETRSYLPGLRDPLEGAVLYPEYITDDARFTLANIRSASAQGARILNHARVAGFLRHNGRILGAEVVDEETGARFEVRAEVTVNATGPWAQHVLTEAGLPVPKPLIPSKGIHILLARDRLPLRGATFLRSPSGRRGLAMPRGPWVYIGTSDDPYDGDLDRPRALGSEVDELVALTADAFPDAGISADDVLATWAGIRPLILEEGKSTRDMSRHDEMWISPPGLVTVAGGKLTTYRTMANRILRKVAGARGRPIPGRDLTHRVPLPGTPGDPLDAFRRRTDGALADAGVDADTRRRLHGLYGTELDDMLARGAEEPGRLERLHPELPALCGEVHRALEDGARSLADVLDRRMALLLFAPGGGLAGAPAAAGIMAGALEWDQDRVAREIEAYAELVREHGPRGSESGSDREGPRGAIPERVSAERPAPHPGPGDTTPPR